MIERFTKAKKVITENNVETRKLTDAIEDQTDAVEDQVKEIEFGAVEFNKYTSSIKSALSSIKTLTGLQERGKREEEDLMMQLVNLKNQTLLLLKLKKILPKLKS